MCITQLHCKKVNHSSKTKLLTFKLILLNKYIHLVQPYQTLSNNNNHPYVFIKLENRHCLMYETYVSTSSTLFKEKYSSIHEYLI